MLAEWILFILFLAYFVVGDGMKILFRGKKKESSLRNLKNRIGFYIQSGMEMWIPATVIIVFMALGVINPNDIGIKKIELHSMKGFSITVAAAAGLYTLFLLYQTVLLRVYATRKQTLKVNVDADILALLPETPKEKLYYVLLSITAGLTEEVLFRGYLFYALGHLFPGLPWVVCLILSSVFFGIMHLYQGLGNALKTLVVGLILGILYLAFGSILPLIVIHILVDVSSVDIHTVREKADETKDATVREKTK